MEGKGKAQTRRNTPQKRAATLEGNAWFRYGIQADEVRIGQDLWLGREGKDTRQIFQHGI